jgi:hypothetical protein
MVIDDYLLFFYSVFLHYLSYEGNAIAFIADSSVDFPVPINETCDFAESIGRPPL